MLLICSFPSKLKTFITSNWIDTGDESMGVLYPTTLFLSTKKWRFAHEKQSQIEFIITLSQL
jgi:hypothetical protein